MRFGGFEFGDLGVGRGVWGVEFTVQGAGFSVWRLASRVQRSGCGVWRFGLSGQGVGFEDDLVCLCLLRRTRDRRLVCGLQINPSHSAGYE